MPPALICINLSDPRYHFVNISSKILLQIYNLVPRAFLRRGTRLANLALLNLSFFQVGCVALETVFEVMRTRLAIPFGNLCETKSKLLLPQVTGWRDVDLRFETQYFVGIINKERRDHLGRSVIHAEGREDLKFTVKNRTRTHAVVQKPIKFVFVKRALTYKGNKSLSKLKTRILVESFFFEIRK